MTIFVIVIPVVVGLVVAALTRLVSRGTAPFRATAVTAVVGAALGFVAAATLLQAAEVPESASAVRRSPLRSPPRGLPSKVFLSYRRDDEAFAVRLIAHGLTARFGPAEVFVVRVEIELALRHNRPVIPVLIGATPMPRPGQLPGSLAPLADRNALRARHESWPDDMARLLAAVQHRRP